MIYENKPVQFSVLEDIFSQCLLEVKITGIYNVFKIFIRTLTFMFVNICSITINKPIFEQLLLEENIHTFSPQ